MSEKHAFVLEWSGDPPLCKCGKPRSAACHQLPTDSR
jgi:hypothetical protein